MSHETAAINKQKGHDKWSGRHPIKGRRSGSWWRRHIRRVMRYLGKRRSEDG